MKKIEFLQSTSKNKTVESGEYETNLKVATHWDDYLTEFKNVSVCTENRPVIRLFARFGHY